MLQVSQKHNSINDKILSLLTIHFANNIWGNYNLDLRSNLRNIPL